VAEVGHFQPCGIEIQELNSIPSEAMRTRLAGYRLEFIPDRAGPDWLEGW